MNILFLVPYIKGLQHFYLIFYAVIKLIFFIMLIKKNDHPHVLDSIIF